jgi:flagellar motor switch protein FliM
MAVTLSPEEIKALMGAINDGRLPSDAPHGTDGAATYDLTSQDRIIRGQMPALDAINEHIASLLAIGLTGRTRVPIRVVTSAATLLKFADLAPLLAPPSAVCIVALGGSHGYALAVLEPGLGESLLAAALGDRRAREGGAAAEGHREFTAVDQQVLKRLLAVVTDALRDAWDGILPFRPTVIRFELDPRMASIAPPSDVAIVSAFEISGGIDGRLQLVLPYAAVEPAKDQLGATRRLLQVADLNVATAVAREIEQVEVDVRAVLGRTRISLSRLLELEPGHLLLLDTDEAKPIPVYVQGREKLRAAPSVAGGAMAVVVAAPVSAGKPPLPPHAQHLLPAHRTAP